MEATQANNRVIAWFLRHTPANNIVIDPILHSSSGTPLLESKAYAFYRQQLLPFATLITPNIPEAGALAGMQVANIDTMHAAAKAIYDETIRFRTQSDKPLGILIKGGHLKSDPVDIYYDGSQFLDFPTKRIEGVKVRGTGCRFAAAIASFLAKGEAAPHAIGHAKEYLLKFIHEHQ